MLNLNLRTNLRTILLAGLASALAVDRTCDQASNNITVSEWPVTSNDTIFSISEATNTGVCDIARYNKMADATLMVAGETLLIPKQICPPNNHSCLLQRQNTTRDCILGGPHTYTTVFNDTLEYVALYKFGITIEAAEAGLIGSVNSSTYIIPTDSTIKIPQCDPSECTIKPYEFLYGTYHDIAPLFNTTVGQIIALNPSYNYSQAGYGDGPTITMPFNCKRLSDNITVIS